MTQRKTLFCSNPNCSLMERTSFITHLLSSPSIITVAAIVLQRVSKPKLQHLFLLTGNHAAVHTDVAHRQMPPLSSSIIGNNSLKNSQLACSSYSLLTLSSA